MCIARLAARQAGTTVTLVDIDSTRRAVAEALGVRFAAPSDAPDEQDVVYHASGNAEGLALSLELLGPDGRSPTSAGTATRPSPSRWAARSTRGG